MGKRNDSQALVFWDKGAILQDARQCFMATSVKTRKLVDILTKCIFVLYQETLTQQEATDLVFHISRLFQYKDKDNTLRRLTHIAIKALSKQQADNVYVVTSSLTNDVNLSNNDDPTIRASALRALCRISEPSKAIEHYLKQAIVDKQPIVASAAIASLIHISTIDGSSLNSFTNEIQQVLHSESPMVQYHALILRYKQVKHDRLAISTLINDCIYMGLKSPLAICLLIRIIKNFANESNGDKDKEAQVYCDHISKIYLNHDSDMVEYEAANSIINIKSISNESSDFKSAVSHLRNFLTSDKAALRFASVRSLNELAANSSSDIRFWSVHRIGGVCKLHLLNKHYRTGDHIIGVLDFSDSNITCLKYTVILQCEETQQYELKQEFSVGMKKNDFMITIPHLVNAKASILHCVLSFLFYIADKNYPKTLFEDRAGTIEVGPSELDTKLFSCDFPIAIYT